MPTIHRQMQTKHRAHTVLHRNVKVRLEVVGGRDSAPLVECLLGFHETLGLVPQHH